GGTSQGGSSGIPGFGGVGASPDCPDLDENLTPDCDETLVKNADFDKDTKNWEPEQDVTAAWSSTDARKVADSGSMDVTTSVAGESTTAGIAGVDQCLAVKGGSTYHFNAEVFIEGGQSPSGSGAINLVYYDEDDCTGLITDSGAGFVG